MQNKDRINQGHGAYAILYQIKSPFVTQDSIYSSKYLQSSSILDYRSLPHQMNARGGYYWNRSVKEIYHQQNHKPEPTLKEGQESSVNLSSNNQTSIQLLGDDSSARKSKNPTVTTNVSRNSLITKAQKQRKACFTRQ